MRARHAIAPLLASVVLLGGCTAAPSWRGEVETIVEHSMAEHHLSAVLLEITVGGEVVLSHAWGESTPGVPATTDMHFRTGSVAIAEMATVLLQLVDEGVVALDDPIADWLPDFAHGDRVTLGDLARMTSGYPDYLWDTAFTDLIWDDPERHWSTQEQLRAFTGLPLLYEPGTNWNYSHSNYVVLGLALEAITGRPLEALLAERILDPLGLADTGTAETGEIREPVLHARTGERGPEIGEAPGFWEDSTFWNPGWTLARGSFQHSTVGDTAALMRAIGRGDLVSAASHAAQVSPELRGRTQAQDGCPTCAAHDERYAFGYGLVLSGDWVMQTPMFHGFAGVGAYLAEPDVAIAISATVTPAGLDPVTGEVPENFAARLFREIAPVIAPGSLPD